MSKKSSEQEMTGEPNDSSSETPAGPWGQSMPEEQFAYMREILAAPSPIGFEASMTRGVLEPRLRKALPDSWGFHTFRGNGGLVVDSAPQSKNAFTVMAIGHADQIRMQVRNVGKDGKIWINSESFLPTTLIGHEVSVFSRDPDDASSWRRLDGATVEAVGAIHFSTPDMRTGAKGIKPEMLYLETHAWGKEPRKRLERLGIRAGDPVIFRRPIRRGVFPDTFYGAYLDNGLGCFVVAEAARIMAERRLGQTVRFLGAFAAYEEIGRMGSRVLAHEFHPDVVIGVDVSHDFKAAPGVASRRFTPVEMGKGYVLARGSITNTYLNTLMLDASNAAGIPVQQKVVGRDTGTDAMAAAMIGVDSAATSIGFPIRNMHTISESGHTGDVLAAAHALVETVAAMEAQNGGKGPTAEEFRANHVRLDRAERYCAEG